MIRQLRRRRGFTTVEILVVTGILTSLGGNGFQNCTNKAHQVACFNQLRQIGMAFQMRANMDEPLPQAWFYPPDNHPARERYNIVNIMKKDGVMPQMFICPSAPDEVKQRGITYLYNDKLCNRNMDSIENPTETWLMMDVNAINQEITPAHNGGCNVLFCDGHVKWLPATAIPNLVTQAVDYRGE
ncbi:MAG: prepilin-type N-terminal cleavage/methylation domain-containing protein [Armatimonadia bacterium]